MKTFAWRLVGLALLSLVVPACVEMGPGSGESSGGPPGHATILKRGGTGTAGPGGLGVTTSISATSASEIRILRSGTVDTSFNLPPDTPTLGGNPRTISADTTYALGAAGPASLAAGDITILGDDGVTPATGLHVLPGATLSFPANLDALGPDGLYDRVELTFANAVLIEGRLTVGRKDAAAPGDGATLNAADLQFHCEAFVSRSKARIDTSATDSASGPGGDGGFFVIAIDGPVINQAKITTNGGQGTNGGDGALCRLRSGQFGSYNSGNITSSGGKGTALFGGRAGPISITGSADPGGNGPAMNRGKLTARGGDGVTAGGDGPPINPGIAVQAQAQGGTVNSGELDKSGGDASDGPGGHALGNVQVVAFNGPVRCSGSIRNKGGRGGGSGNGGNGGPVAIAMTLNGAIFPDPNIVGGGLRCSASIDTSGGDGAAGGNAGGLSIFVTATGPVAIPGNDPLELVGYESMDSSGGNGTTAGGRGGGLLVLNNEASIFSGLPVKGGILNEVPLTTRGGDGLAGEGGRGGLVQFATDNTTPSAPPYDRSVTNRGAIDTRGGAGKDAPGGMGGAVDFFDHFLVVNKARIISSGGDGACTGGAGGDAGPISMRSDDVVKNDGNLLADGGSSGDPLIIAAPGGSITLTSTQTSTSGTLRARGGDNVAGSTLIGGLGGTITILSSDRASSVHGTLEVSGGIGTPVGAPGILSVDGVILDAPLGNVFL